MRALLLCLCGLVQFHLADARAGDPLHSAVCVQALATLHDAEEALASRTGAQLQAGSDRRLLHARLGVLKQRAATLCLGHADTPASAARQVPAAPAVNEPPRQPSAVATPPSARTAPAPAPTPPPAPVLSLVSCDAAGCWASDGTRLQRSGNLLLGPRGYCSAAGSVLNCPW